VLFNGTIPRRFPVVVDELGLFYANPKEFYGVYKWHQKLFEAGCALASRADATGDPESAETSCGRELGLGFILDITQ
jgi:hypothetical protein